ncbi:hypothetical protein AB1Y20_004204 [Prymnesium parvum]|uniref:TMC domain-containing protein n=1 Tax=Prymnesium parvum TaxID=97485 RepID=A0AB34J6Y5_PRYPA
MGRLLDSRKPLCIGSRGRSSLAYRTGRSTSLVISTAILLAHLFFGYAQWCGQQTDCDQGSGDSCIQGGQLSIGAGGLFRGQVTAHVDFSAQELLALVEAAAESLSCPALIDCPQGKHTPVKLQANITNVCTVLECGGGTMDQTIFHHSYWFSISKMWMQDASSNHTGFYPARPAAGALFGFSFVWPHLKLLLMHLAFYLPLTAHTRRNGNYWLAFWGKWSLADALVMCCLIGLFNLTIDMDLVDVWNYFHRDIDALCHSECTRLLNSTAGSPSLDCNHTCATLSSVLRLAAFNHAALPSSDIFVNLRVSGLIAMYAFCAAVLISLTTGVLIENLDEERREEEATPPPPPLEAPLAAREFEGVGTLLSTAAEDEPPPPLVRRVSLLTRVHARDGGSSRSWLLVHTVLVSAQFILAVCALYFPIFTRNVGGGIGYALQDRGIDFNGHFSMFQLAWLAGQAGGPDYFMAGTCFVFLVVGPLLRPITQLWLMWVPMSIEAQKGLHRASRHISIFYAFEVMLLAVPLLNLAFGPMTNSFLSPGNFKPCGPLQEQYNTPDECLEINVNAASGYYFTVAAYSVYLMSGVDGSPTHKFLHRSLYPEDRTPPSC